MELDLLLRALADLSKVATDEQHARVLLTRLCEVAAAALPVDAVGVMITGERGNRFVHATTHGASDLERVQETLRSGPCRDAARTGRAVLANGDLSAWPQFEEVAAGAEIGSVAAVPLMARGRCWGVLDLYRRSAEPWTDADVEAAALLTDVAATFLVMTSDRDATTMARAQADHDSTHDHLTGLANRRLLFDRLEHSLAAAPRRGDGVGVLFIDLDRFKEINDAFGHHSGDVVLREVARRLSAQLRSGDTLGRLAGDEFLWICDDLPLSEPVENEAQMADLAGRVDTALREPVRLDRGEVHVTAAVGWAQAPGGQSAEQLISAADLAMYRTKTRRPAPTAEDLAPFGGSTLLRGQLTFEHDLSMALGRGELVVHYQPIVEAAQPHRIHAVESLLRWYRSDGTVVMAADFIDAAGRRGMMPTVGAWVIEESCRQMQAWSSELGDLAPPMVYVNLSAGEVQDPGLPRVLASALDRHGLSPEQVGLEIVEDNFLQSGLLSRLHELRQTGHPLSIDDFGTGYSSLSRLFELTVDCAKIDKAFVRGTPEDGRRTGFVEAVLAIARSLGIAVAAEGVETEAQRDFLRDAGCQMLQGYLFAKPQPAADLTALLLQEAVVT